MNKENKYVVYVHRRKDNDKIFYVGSGTNARVNQTTNRNSKWLGVARAIGFYPEILVQNLAKEEARDIEGLLITMIQDLVNVTEPVSSALIIPSDVYDLIYYDESSPTLIRWLKDRKPGIKANDPAGRFEFRNGNPHRVRVTINGINYAVHRLVYNLLNGSISNSLVIDHIDGNPHNNLISNLREVSNVVNSQNMNNSSRNKSGVVGVYFKTNQDGNSYWVASWRDSNKIKTKNFMAGKYGYENAFKLACEFRAGKIKELNNKGASYTERHQSLKE